MYHHHCHLDHDQTIETAVRAGLNYVDTSPFYGEGKSEEVLGMVTTMRVIIMMMTTMVLKMITTNHHDDRDDANGDHYID